MAPVSVPVYHESRALAVPLPYRSGIPVLRKRADRYSSGHYESRAELQLEAVDDT